MAHNPYGGRIAGHPMPRKERGGVEFAVWRMIARQPVQAMGLKTKRPMICQTAFGPEPNGSHREQ